MSGATRFACDMSALTPEQRSRHSQLAMRLQSMLRSVRDLPDGFEFEFPFDSATYEVLSELTPLEHACCPFFTIAIRLEQDNLLWQLTGHEGVKQFIRMEFSEWFF
jgi:hypothetical protein